MRCSISVGQHLGLVRQQTAIRADDGVDGLSRSGLLRRPAEGVQAVRDVLALQLDQMVLDW